MAELASALQSNSLSAREEGELDGTIAVSSAIGSESAFKVAPLDPNADLALVSTLGEGGMGRVLLAHQRSLSRDVAVKMVKPGAAAHASGGLLREARITGALEHPGVVPIHELAFDEGGLPMLVMKRVDGVDLGTLLANEAHPAWKTRGRSGDRFVAALEILVQVCLTLEFAHSRGIIHRDVKPKNIMVGSFGEVYLLDWGIATKMDAPQVAVRIGTPAYMSPEMALGQATDQRTDVYLVGATLHEILTRKARHRGETLDEVVASAIASEPFVYAESVPAELARLCNRAMARNPSDRPASVEEVREAIGAFLRHRGTRALNEAALERLVELETLLAAPGPPKDLTLAYRLVTEARFGLALNLRENATDATARDGMHRCLALAVELELRQDHGESAGALLREMETPDPNLVTRVEDVRVRTTAYDRERRRLVQLEQEVDPSQHSGQRGILLFLFCLVGIVVGRTITLGGHLSPERVTAGSVATTGLFIAGLIVTRRRIVWNAFNKQLISLIIVAMVTVVVHRYVALVYRTPAHETMTIDLVIACGMALYAAYAFIPRLVLAAIPLLVGIPAALAWPNEAPFISVAAMASSAPIAALVVMKVEKPGGRSK
jgi:serine/threonine-protein kinase